MVVSSRPAFCPDNPPLAGAIVSPWQAYGGGWSSGCLGPARRTVVNGLVFLILLAVVMLWWQTTVRGADEVNAAMTGAKAESRNVAQLLAAQLQGRLAWAESQLPAARAVLLGHGDKQGVRLAARVNHAHFAVLDTAAAVVFSTGLQQPATQALAAQSLDGAGLGSSGSLLLAGAAAGGEQGELSLLLPLRRDARLYGGLLISFDRGEWFRHFRAIDFGRGGELSVLTANGDEVHRVRGQVQLPPRPATPPGRMLASGLAGVEPFTAIDEEGRERIYALARVGESEVFVAASKLSEDVLEPVTRARRQYLQWAAQATLLFGLATAGLLSLFRRHRSTYDALLRTESQNRSLIDRLEREKSKAYQLAYYDQLTGLANRTFFSLMAQDRLAGSRRRRKDSAVLFIDLDRFKAVNDTFGHRIGDLLLVEVGRRLTGSLREADLVSRFGGDEFVVQITDVESVEDLDHVAAKIVDAISQPMDLDGHLLIVKPSLGIAINPQDGDTLEMQLRNADAAMYEAKRAGNGIYRFFDAQLNAKARRLSDLEQRLRQAIAADEFVIHYQPRLDTNGYRIVTLEALVRWQHPEHGLVFPGDFIPRAEENGSIVELGAHIVRRVCGQIADWRARGLTPPPVAINASARQLRDDGFVHLIRDAVSQAGITFDMIEIEVTESCVMEDPEVSAAILGELVDLGVRVSLDDFGTGYSSLSSLKRLPLYAIKIDRSFVADIGIDANDDVIVASTISMGHGLGLRMVAEGVETQAQLIRLRMLGCEEVQGYLFSRPLPVDEVEKLLQQGQCPPGMGA